MSNKQGTTIRLSLETRDLLKNAGRITDRSNSDIVEDALQDWFTKHNLQETYRVTITASNIVLSESGNILEVTERNGVPPREIAQNYKRKLQAPVRLVIQEDATCLKKQS